MSVIQPIPITKLIEALLDESAPFSPKYLHRLSDLDTADTAVLAETWPKVTHRRREALLEDLEEIHLADDLQNFESVARIGLQDAEPGVRIRAIRILREYELVELLSTFVDMAEHDTDTEVRANAAEALGSYVYLGEVEEISSSKSQRVEECLLRLTSTSEPKLVQRKALESLGYSSRNEVMELIEKAFISSDTEWQGSALLAMGRSANPHWNSRVLKMLTHPKPDIRAEAASAAGELEIRKATPLLMELLEDSDLDVRMAAIWALSQVGGEGVQKALENQLNITEDDEETNQIGNALENLEFTNEMREIALLEIPEEDEDEDSELPSEEGYDEYSDDLFSEDEID